MWFGFRIFFFLRIGPREIYQVSHVIVRLKFTQLIPGVTIVYNQPWPQKWTTTIQTPAVLLLLLLRDNMCILAKRSFVQPCKNKISKKGFCPASALRWEGGGRLSSLTSQRSLCVSVSRGRVAYGKEAQCLPSVYIHTHTHGVLHQQPCCQLPKVFQWLIRQQSHCWYSRRPLTIA